LKRPLDYFLEGRVESLDVPDLQDGPSTSGLFHKDFRLNQIGGQGFFHQEMNSRTKEFDGDGEMKAGWDGDDGSVHPREQKPMIGVGLGPKTVSHGLGLLRVGVGDSHQLDSGNARQNAGVFFAQVSDPDHGHPQAGHAFLRHLSEVRSQNL
jgi:hypothetical protein